MTTALWHPENLAVDDLLRSHGPAIGERVLWLGHSVYVKLANDQEDRKAGKASLKTEHLRKIMGRHTMDTARQAAEDAGYVLRDRSYRVGAYSQSYSIAPPYAHARLVRHAIADPRLRNTIQAWHTEQAQDRWKRINRNETRIDAATCRHLWNQLRRIEIDAEIDRGVDFHPAHQVSFEQVREKAWWFVVDDFGRLHTNVTSLPRRLRANLTVDGQRLVNIDISESQPLFMGMAIATNQARQGEGREAGGGEAGTHTPASPFMLDNVMLDSDTLLGGEIERNRLPSDLRRYVELCEARGLYQAVADRLGKTRDEAKQSVMVVFFDKSCHHNKASSVLEELFPAVMLAVQRIKRSDYRRLAHFAQRIESAFMFGRVVPRIMKLRPDLFLATIHDSILTTTKEGAFVQGVMHDEFRHLGLSPQVKVEPCVSTPENCLLRPSA